MHSIDISSRLCLNAINMRIDLNKNPNILREPKTYEDALVRRAEILTLFEDTNYDPYENGLYKKATEQVHELLAAKLELEALRAEEAEKNELKKLSPKERRAAEVHKRAEIARHAALAPKEPAAAERIPVVNKSVGVEVTVNKRDEVLPPAEVVAHRAR